MKRLPALIVIDMQNDFVLPGAAACVAGAHATIPAIAQAIAAFRQRHWPVIYLVREYKADGSDIEAVRLDSFFRRPYAVPGTPGCEIVEEIAPQPEDYRIVKNRFSGFMRTELDFVLRRLGVGELLICGTQYPNCIRATAYDAIAYSFRTVVLSDCSSAATPEIAEANITDLRNVGIPCIPFPQWLTNRCALIR